MKMQDYILRAHQVGLRNIENRGQLVGELVSSFLEKQPKTLWIVASGSSYNSTYCALPFLNAYLPCTVKLVAPMTFSAYDVESVQAEDLVIVVSQSGYSTNAIEALDKLGEKGFYRIGMTGDVQSDFQYHSDLLVDYGSEIESVHYVTQGVTTMVVFWHLFALEVALKAKSINDQKYHDVLAEMEIILREHPQIINQTNAFIDKHHLNLLRTQIAYFLGIGSNYGTALEASLKFSETVHIPCLTFESEEYIHGPNLQLDPSYSVFLLGNGDHTSPRVNTLFEATREITKDAYLITSDRGALVDDRILDVPKHQELLNSLVFLPVVQTLASRISSFLNRKQHPLLVPFKQIAKSKTENYVDDEGVVTENNV